MSSPVELFQVRRLAFEYEDCPGTFKERPVVVGGVSDEEALVLVAKVTGHGPRSEFPGEVRLRYWAEAGLDKPSTVRCSKTVLVDLDDLADSVLVGVLLDEDADSVRNGLREAGKVD